MKEKLVLYHFPTWPYCRIVLDYTKKNNIELIDKNIQEKNEYKEELLQLGGKIQVPCLLIDGKVMYESGDIMRWLKENQ